jgi:hypothetical protein
MTLKDAMQQVLDARRANDDVFVWTQEPWTLEYIHEETTEWARYVQRDLAPEHARNGEVADDARLGEHMEFGQVLMMVLTLGIQRGLDPDKALALACEKIAVTAAKQRAAQAAPQNAPLPVF